MGNLDNFGVMARVKDFDTRNGGNPVPFQSWLYYKNGAKREEWPMGALVEPPKDEYHRLSNVVCYHQSRLNTAVAEFDALKERLMMVACPEPGSLDRLRELQAVVSERNAAVVEAKAKLAATDEGKRREQYRQTTAENQARTNDFRNTVKNIRV